MTRCSPVRRLLALGALVLVAGTAQANDITLLNVSYDPTRELYVDVGLVMPTYRRHHAVRPHRIAHHAGSEDRGSRLA